MNKIILIGGDHHNGLGLVRSFGVNGFHPFGIIVTKGRSFISKSKYWDKTLIVENEEDAIEYVLENFSAEKEKPVIIPYSDGAAAAVDNNLDRLSSYFITPSLGGRQGAIVELMDKQKQIEFLKKYDLPMAKSWTLSLPYQGDASELIFPCICKPVSSYEGTKADIKRCDNCTALLAYLKVLVEKGYKRILIQEYISFDYESGLFAACGKEIAFIATRKLRLWPVIGGTSSFAQVTTNKTIVGVCEELFAALQAEKFNGLFDADLFMVGDRVLINEINWRNSGNTFLSLGSKVYCAVIWYLNAIGEESSFLLHTCYDTTQIAMNEATDMRNVIFGGLSLSSWLKDFKRSNNYALWFRKDLLPTMYRYTYLAKELLSRRFFHKK